jgi:hypothetical protein
VNVEDVNVEGEDEKGVEGEAGKKNEEEVTAAGLLDLRLLDDCFSFLRSFFHSSSLSCMGTELWEGLAMGTLSLVAPMLRFVTGGFNNVAIFGDTYVFNHVISKHAV